MSRIKAKKNFLSAVSTSYLHCYYYIKKCSIKLQLLLLDKAEWDIGIDGCSCMAGTRIHLFIPQQNN